MNTTDFTSKQMQLLEFVKEMHGDQKRKYTGEPYWHHLVRVANMAGKHINHPYAFEIGMCHDLFEDTDCIHDNFCKELINIGYSNIFDIVDSVNELTNEFTEIKYPNYSRDERKMREKLRLSKSKILSQSVKYCDIIDNISTIVEEDPKFAEVYIEEKFNVLKECRKGDIHLFVKAFNTVQQAKEKLAAVL